MKEYSPSIQSSGKKENQRTTKDKKRRNSSAGMLGIRQSAILFKFDESAVGIPGAPTSQKQPLWLEIHRNLDRKKQMDATPVLPNFVICDNDSSRSDMAVGFRVVILGYDDASGLIPRKTLEMDIHHRFSIRFSYGISDGIPASSLQTEENWLFSTYKENQECCASSMRIQALIHSLPAPTVRKQLSWGYEMKLAALAGGRSLCAASCKLTFGRCV